ncbi:TPA_asm: polyprotein [Eleocharis dulcis waikavirus]|uniref:Genome polyprotein n=1 Tax=Eleocharis dulcis waikavirus TaxID=3027339 RepID=A0AA48SFL7_9SECO|nr:TPA_asm: polyprotein [Eleocharis dulcis waikavirus]
MLVSRGLEVTQSISNKTTTTTKQTTFMAYHHQNVTGERERTQLVLYNPGDPSPYISFHHYVSSACNHISPFGIGRSIYCNFCNLLHSIHDRQVSKNLHFNSLDLFLQTHSVHSCDRKVFLASALESFAWFVNGRPTSVTNVSGNSVDCSGHDCSSCVSRADGFDFSWNLCKPFGDLFECYSYEYQSRGYLTPGSPMGGRWIVSCPDCTAQCDFTSIPALMIIFQFMLNFTITRQRDGSFLLVGRQWTGFTSISSDTAGYLKGVFGLIGDCAPNAHAEPAITHLTPLKEPFNIEVRFCSNRASSYKYNMSGCKCPNMRLQLMGTNVCVRMTREMQLLLYQLMPFKMVGTSPSALVLGGVGGLKGCFALCNLPFFSKLGKWWSGPQLNIFWKKPLNALKEVGLDSYEFKHSEQFRKNQEICEDDLLVNEELLEITFSSQAMSVSRVKKLRPVGMRRTGSASSLTSLGSVVGGLLGGVGDCLDGCHNLVDYPLNEVIGAAQFLRGQVADHPEVVSETVGSCQACETLAEVVDKLAQGLKDAQETSDKNFGALKKASQKMANALEKIRQDQHKQQKRLEDLEEKGEETPTFVSLDDFNEVVSTVNDLVEGVNKLLEASKNEKSKEEVPKEKPKRPTFLQALAANTHPTIPHAWHVIEFDAPSFSSQGFSLDKESRKLGTKVKRALRKILHIKKHTSKDSSAELEVVESRMFAEMNKEALDLQTPLSEERIHLEPTQVSGESVVRAEVSQATIVQATSPYYVEGVRTLVELGTLRWESSAGVGKKIAYSLPEAYFNSLQRAGSAARFYQYLRVTHIEFEISLTSALQQGGTLMVSWDNLGVATAQGHESLYQLSQLPHIYIHAGSSSVSLLTVENPSILERICFESSESSFPMAGILIVTVVNALNSPAQSDQHCLVTFSARLCNTDLQIYNTQRKVSFSQGGFENELNVQKEMPVSDAIVHTGSWTTTTGAQLCNLIVHPCACHVAEKQIFQHPLAILSSVYTRWSGSLIYTFVFGSSVLDKGKLAYNVLPNRQAQKALSRADATHLPGAFVDLASGKREFELTVPFVSTGRSTIVDDLFIYDTGAFNSKFIVNKLFVTVVANLVKNMATQNKVDYFVTVRPGPDFKLYTIRGVRAQLLNRALSQSGKVSLFSGSRLVGDRWRGLVEIPSILFQCKLEANGKDHNGIRWSVTPAMRSFVPHSNLLGWVSQMFACWSGSLIYTIYPHSFERNKAPMIRAWFDAGGRISPGAEEAEYVKDLDPPAGAQVERLVLGNGVLTMVAPFRARYRKLMIPKHGFVVDPDFDSNIFYNGVMNIDFEGEGNATLEITVQGGGDFQFYDYSSVAKAGDVSAEFTKLAYSDKLVDIAGNPQPTDDDVSVGHFSEVRPARKQSWRSDDIPESGFHSQARSEGISSTLRSIHRAAKIVDKQNSAQKLANIIDRLDSGTAKLSPFLSDGNLAKGKKVARQLESVTGSAANMADILTPQVDEQGLKDFFANLPAFMSLTTDFMKTGQPLVHKATSVIDFIENLIAKCKEAGSTFIKVFYTGVRVSWLPICLQGFLTSDILLALVATVLAIGCLTWYYWEDLDKERIRKKYYKKMMLALVLIWAPIFTTRCFGAIKTIFNYFTQGVKDTMDSVPFGFHRKQSLRGDPRAESGFFEKLNFLTGPLVGLLLSIVGVAVWGVSALTAGKGSLRSKFAEFSKLGRDMNGVGQGLRTIREWAVFLGNTLVTWLTGSDLVGKSEIAALSLMTRFDVAAWSDEVRKLSLEEERYADFGSDAYIKKIRHLYDKSIIIKNAILEGEISPFLTQSLREYTVQARDLLNATHTLKGMNQSRIDPIFICLKGEPGVGKSSISHIMINDLLDEMGEPKVDRVYVRCCADAYWSNYHQQPCVFYDDLGAVNSALKLSDYAEILGAKTNDAFSLNMAAVEHKGQYFNSKYIVACTNQLWLDNNSDVVTPGAFYRRRNFLVKVRRDQGVAMDPENPTRGVLFQILEQRKGADGMILETEFVKTAWTEPWMLGAEDTPEWMPYKQFMEILTAYTKGYMTQQEKLVDSIKAQRGGYRDVVEDMVTIEATAEALPTKANLYTLRECIKTFDESCLEWSEFLKILRECGVTCAANITGTGPMTVKAFMQRLCDCDQTHMCNRIGKFGGFAFTVLQAVESRMGLNGGRQLVSACITDRCATYMVKKMREVQDDPVDKVRLLLNICLLIPLRSNKEGCVIESAWREAEIQQVNEPNSSTPVKEIFMGEENLATLEFESQSALEKYTGLKEAGYFRDFGIDWKFSFRGNTKDLKVITERSKGKEELTNPISCVATTSLFQLMGTASNFLDDEEARQEIGEDLVGLFRERGVLTTCALQLLEESPRLIAKKQELLTPLPTFAETWAKYLQRRTTDKNFVKVLAAVGIIVGTIGVMGASYAIGKHFLPRRKKSFESDEKEEDEVREKASSEMTSGDFRTRRPRTKVVVKAFGQMKRQGNLASETAKAEVGLFSSGDSKTKHIKKKKVIRSQPYLESITADGGHPKLEEWQQNREAILEQARFVTASAQGQQDPPARLLKELDWMLATKRLGVHPAPNHKVVKKGDLVIKGGVMYNPEIRKNLRGYYIAGREDDSLNLKPSHYQGEQLLDWEEAYKKVVSCVAERNTVVEDHLTVVGDYSKSGDKQAAQLLTTTFKRMSCVIVTTHQKKLANVIQVVGGWVLCPAHYSEIFVNGEQALFITTTKICKFTVDWSHAVFVGNHQDLLVWWLGPEIPPSDNFLKQFPSQDDWSYFHAGEGLLSLSLPDKMGTHQMTCQLPKIELCDGTTLVPAAEYTIHNGSHDTIQGLRYHVFSTSGYCGALIIRCDSRMTAKVVGMHVAGADNCAVGYGETLVRESIQAAMEKGRRLWIEGDIVAEQEFSSQLGGLRQYQGSTLGLGNLGVLGEVDATKVPPVPTKTTIIKSPIHGMLGKAQTQPSILNKWDRRLGALRGEFDPLLSGVKKYGADIVPFPEKQVKEVEDFLKDHFRLKENCLKERRVRSLDEAINGVPGTDFFAPTNLETSAGWPYVHRKPKGARGKEWLFRKIGEYPSGQARYVVDDLQLMDRIETRIAQAKLGRTTPLLPMECLKDERRKLKKIFENPATRTFTILPVDYNLVLRMYFLDFACMVMKCRSSSFTQVGINPCSLEWTNLMHRMCANGKTLGFAGDYGKFDGIGPPAIYHSIVNVINAWYNDGEESALVRHVLIDQSVHRMSLVGNLVLQVGQGLPSGFAMTVIFNSIVNFYFMSIAWVNVVGSSCLSYHASVREFARLTDIITYGDDNCVSVDSDFISIFNLRSVAKFLSSFGVTYTDDAKNPIELSEPHKRIVDFSFLKRTWVTLGKGSLLWKAPLDETSIKECCFWLRETDDRLAALDQNVEGSLFEMAIHGKEKYESWKRTLETAYDRLNRPLPPSTYENERAEWWKRVTGARLGSSDVLDLVSYEIKEDMEELLTTSTKRGAERKIIDRRRVGKFYDQIAGEWKALPDILDEVAALPALVLEF